MMDQLIQEFPDQLREALSIGQGIKVSPHAHPIHHVLVCGLGGSGIGGNFVSELTSEERKIPFLVSKGYQLPGYTNENSLIIFSSYSGNTEETLMAFDQALKTGAKIVCIASGGKLIDRAIANGFDYVQVPANKPSPRACLGYSIVQQIFILTKLGLISDKLSKEIDAAANLLDAEMEDIKNRADHIASFLEGKMPIIYCEDAIESVAIRLRQQINENSKMLCWHHVIPEMNHNELVGWRTHNKDLAVLLLRNKVDFSRNQLRMDINKEIINQYTNTFIEIHSKGNNKFERAMYLVHLGDWISWYLSERQPKIDAVEVEVINYLKSELGKVEI